MPRNAALSKGLFTRIIDPIFCPLELLSIVNGYGSKVRPRQSTTRPNILRWHINMLSILHLSFSKMTCISSAGNRISFIHRSVSFSLCLVRFGEFSSPDKANNACEHLPSSKTILIDPLARNYAFTRKRPCLTNCLLCLI